MSGCGGGSSSNAPSGEFSASSSPSSTTPSTSSGNTAPASTPTTGTAPAASPFTGKVTLQWDPDPQGTLAGYKVYYQADSASFPFTGTGATQGNSPVDVGSQTTATITGLDLAHHTYYFAVTAYNSAGQESGFSNVFSFP